MKSFLPRRGIRLVAALAVALGTAGVASLTTLSTSAQADPSATTAYVGVGADVTQDYWEAVSGAAQPDSPTTAFYTPVHSSSATDNRTVQSFDAFPAGGTTVNAGCITTLFGGPSFDRPNSTTNGITALLDAINGTGWEDTTNTSCTNTPVNVTGQINFARAARGPKTTGTTLTFIPYGRDALGVLVFDHGDGVLNSLSTAQLKAIYSSTTGTTTIGGDTVEGCLSISGSAPRSNLESAIGVSEAIAGAEAQADDPSGTTDCSQIQQNSGNAFYDGFASSLPAHTDAIVPISSGDWIAQNNGVAVDESADARAGGASLSSITDGSNVLGSPFTGTGTSLRPNTTYYQSTSYGYNLNTVVPTVKITAGPNEDHGLVSLFVGATSPLCSSAQELIMNTFGFDDVTGTEGTCGTGTTGNS
jgi:hypothetical protein